MQYKPGKMKRLFIVISAVVFIGAIATSCQNSSANNAGNSDSLNMMSDAANYTTAAFTDSIQDFGKVPRGEQVKILFHIKNTGTKPLLIASVRPSCGCTVADFTKSPIAPGREGEVNGTFDSNHGVPGQIRKTITVTTNTSPKNNMLIFTGEVLPKDSTETK